MNEKKEGEFRLNAAYASRNAVMLASSAYVAERSYYQIHDFQSLYGGAGYGFLLGYASALKDRGYLLGKGYGELV